MNCSYARVSTDDQAVEVQMRHNLLMVTQLDRKLGRRLKLPPHQRRDVIRLPERGELLQEIAVLQPEPKHGSTAPVFWNDR